MENKIYRSYLTVEILSEEPLYEEGCWALKDIAYHITNGDWSGATNWASVNEELTGKEAVKAVLSQGSDPEFFQMDQEGNNLEEI